MLSFLRYNLLFAVLFAGYSLYAQNKVEIVHADDLLFDEKLGNGAKRLIGNVQFKQANSTMYCDSAYFYSNNTLDAYSNVRIQQGDSVNIYGQFLKYNGNTRVAELQKNIRFVQKSSTLQTELLYYDMATSVATYPNGGTIVSKQNTLVSQYGNYNPKKKFFSFKKNVVLTNPQYVMTCDTLNYSSGSNTAFFAGPTQIKSKNDFIYCESGWYNTDNDNAEFSKNAYIITKQQKMKGDTIYYEKTKDIGKAFGHVSIIDSVQSIIVTGDKAIHIGKLETSTVTGHTLLKQYYGKDTLFLHADTLLAVDEHPVNNKNVKDTSVTWRVMHAYRKVKFFRSDIQGKCDSLVYSGKDSLMRLYKSPVLWSDQNQLTGEQVQIKTSGGEIKNLYLKNMAFIISKVDTGKKIDLTLVGKDSTGGRYNQIKGKEMTGYFKNNKLAKILVEGNGQTIYYAKDGKKNIGINKADCSDLMIFVKDNAVKKITFLKKPDATLFPMSDYKPKEYFLKDFVWRGKERPLSKADIFLK